MAPAQNTQLEHLISEALKSGDGQALEVFLQREIYEETPMKCSQQFLSKLDKLICRGLVQKDPKLASIGFASLYNCGKHLILPGGGQGLSRLIAQGLIKKWFGKCRQLWIQCGPQWDGNLINLSEDFLNVLSVVHEACKEGTYKITESFLYPIGQLAVDPRIYVLIQKEAIRKFNLILDKIPVELKTDTKILMSQEASDIMIKLADQIMDVGDYDFQSSLMEALCRMATTDQRKELADKWFRMSHVASAFAKIRDSEFETACRTFLNMVNGMQGDKRRVYSYPCLEAYLDSSELLMPSDEKLEEFWIDFNLGSHSISFYFCLADEEDSHWETICINEHEVQSYSVKEEGKRQFLQIKLSEVVIVGAAEGSSVTIHFSSSLDILQAVQNIYGHSKNKGSSVVKATAKSLMENNTQVVPESQVSLGESGKSTVNYVLPATAAPPQVVTPAKIKISEATAFFSSSSRGGSVHRSFSLASNTPANGIGTEKSSLEVSTAPKQAIKNKGDKYKKSMPLRDAVNMVLAEQGGEKSQEENFVPDTQPRTGSNMASNWHKFSVSEMLMMPTEKTSSLPRSEPFSSMACPQERSLSSRWSDSASSSVCQKQLHIQLSERLQWVLKERNQDSPPPEASDIRRDSNETNAEDQYVSSLCTSKPQHAHSNGRAKGKSKGQTSLEIGAVPIKPPVKTSTTKTLKEKKRPKSETENKRAQLDKEKRDSEVAGSMVKLISSRYKDNGQPKEKHTSKKITQNWFPSLVNGPIFKMFWLSTGKRETSRNPIKSNSKTKGNSSRQREDIFAFSTSTPLSSEKENINTYGIQSSDIHSPVLLSTTKKEQLVAKKKGHVKKHLFSDTDADNAATEVSWLRESATRPKPNVTKYSRQAPIKPRPVPQHASFESPDLVPTFPRAGLDNNKPTKKNSHMKRDLGQPKERVKSAAAPSRQHAASKRPKRVAATSTKSYKEPDTDDSQSEEPKDPPATKYSFSDRLKKTEDVHEAQKKKKKTDSTQQTKNIINPCAKKPATSKKYFVGQQKKHDNTCSEVSEVKIGKHTSEQAADTYRRKRNNNQSDLNKPSVLKQRPENVPQETSRLNKTNGQEQMSSLKDSWAICQTSFCPSPPLMEKMRSADRSVPTLDLTCSPLLTPRGSPLPASPKPSCQDTPSPVLLLPKPKVRSKEMCKSSFYTAEKNHGSSKTHSRQSVPSFTSLGGQTPAPSPPPELSAAKISTIEQHLSSAPHSPLSTRPLLTSTLLELDKPPLPSPAQSPFPNDTISHGHRCSLSKVSSVSQISLSQSSTNSSVLTGKVKDSATVALALSVRAEMTPLSDQDSKLAQSHVSGPSRKRHISLSSHSEDEETEERMISKMRGSHSPHMKPRKLFKSFEVPAMDELSQVKSSSGHWEAEVTDGDVDIDEDLDLPEISVKPRNLCQQFSSELKKKFQKRYSMMELYNKQSLKIMQQHISSINMQITECRSQGLKQIQKVLLDEIHKLEQDDTVLKNMDKDLTMYWKKQMTAFHSYQKQEIMRNELLKRALQSNTCHSLEYEERIFTSEMGTIRKDMKSVQDKFLSEMLEGELQCVKKGLHALFFP